MLLEVIEEARDRLGLPPGDPARELYELMLDRDAQGRVDDLLRRGETAERDLLVGEVEELRDKLRESKARITKLERGLRAEEASLRRLPAQQPTAARTPVAATAPTAPSEADEQERRRLRAKVEELKHLLTERNEERTALRRQLAKANDAMVAEAPDAGRFPEADETHLEDGAAVEAPRELLTPSFTAASGADLRGLPAGVAHKALLTVAALSGETLPRGGRSSEWPRRQRRSFRVASASITGCCSASRMGARRTLGHPPQGPGGGHQTPRPRGVVMTGAERGVQPARTTSLSRSRPPSRPTKSLRIAAFGCCPRQPSLR